MEPKLHDNEHFENLDFAGQPVPKSEYYQCWFRKCNFNKCDLSEVDFDECIFTDCDLTMAVLRNAGMRNIRFEQCKLLGVDFSICNTFRFEVGFVACVLDYSIFFKLKMPKTQFRNCTLKEAEFAEADLSQALFDRCDMENAGFAFTNLEKADLSTAFNYRIDPEQTRIRRAQFTYPAVLGLLSKYDITVT